MSSYQPDSDPFEAIRPEEEKQMEDGARRSLLAEELGVPLLHEVVKEQRQIFGIDLPTPQEYGGIDE